MKKGVLAWGAIVIVLLFGITVVASCEQPFARKPIEITSDLEFTEENGVVAGTGKVNDPYIIEGWKIDAGYHDYGIRIHRTESAFVIRNVEISGAAKAAIYLSYVSNGHIEDCELVGNWIGITLNYASLNRIRGCTLASNADGIHLRFSSDNQVLSNKIEGNEYVAMWLYASNTNEIIGNVLEGSHMGVYLDLGSEGNSLYENAFLNNVHNAHSDELNQWDCNQEGNYWSDYKGIDANKDGIGDSPYVITSDGDQDNFPLFVAPVSRY